MIYSLFYSLAQSRVHWRLAALRPALLSAASQPQQHEATYGLPRGGLFRFVCCPHYLAEIVLYSGLALLLGPSPRAWLMWLVVAFTALNLTHAALATRRWYEQKFASMFPRSCRAIIPFVL